jgi:uncharacterized delta-60 repeat protein/CSLREA domain-containing protein
MKNHRFIESFISLAAVVTRYGVLFALLLWSSYAFTAYARPGDLDPGFGQNGTVTTPIGEAVTTEEANSVVLQGDGKVVAGGYTNRNGNVDFALARYNADGTLDSSFGTGGEVVTAISSASDVINAVAVQSDGKIIAAGITGAGTGQQNIALARYNSDGSLDTSFGSNGIVITVLGPPENRANAVALQRDGKIVVAGSSWSNSARFGAVLRYNSDGSLDSSFGQNGIALISNLSSEQPNAIVVQADGKLVTAGTTFNGVHAKISLIRLTSGGAYDSTFGNGGKVLTSVSAGADIANDLAVQADGKLVAAGSTTGSLGEDTLVVRYNRDGSLDSSFGSGGSVATPVVEGNDHALGVAIQSDGKIVTSGEAEIAGPSTAFSTVRYQANGALDTSFGNQGIALTPVISRSSRGPLAVPSSPFTSSGAHDLAVQSDGRIVSAGGLGVSRDFAPTGDFALLRYNANGTLDSGFGDAGTLTTGFGGGLGSSTISGLARQHDGKLVAVGTAYNGINSDFAIARYNLDGSLDRSFGDSGIVLTPIAGGDDTARDVAIQPDGKIVVAGDYATGYGHSIQPVVARYNSTGTLDATFGNHGLADIYYSGGITTDKAYAVALQADGKIVIAGSTNPNQNASLPAVALARFNRDGSLDIGFGNQGRVVTHVGNNAEAFDVALQSDGRIVVAGIGDFQFLVIRYNPTGSLDMSFGANGIVRTDPDAGGYANALALQADGKIVVGGTSLFGDTAGFAVARYKTDGSLDNSFGFHGIQIDHIFQQSIIEDIALQSDGKIVAAGYNYDLRTTRFAVARYNADGTNDSSFGTNPNQPGVVLTAVGADYSYANALVLQPDGKIVAAGSTARLNNGISDFALARYLGDVQAGPQLTVTTTDDHDDGACTINDCTLREAINAANGTGDVTIEFNIPNTDAGYNQAAGTFTIAPKTPLPALTHDGITLDGLSQPGARANTLASGSDAVLKIVLDGSAAGNTDGLRILAARCTAQGMVIDRFTGNGIYLRRSNNKILGNFIGVAADGRTAAHNGGAGIMLDSNAIGNVIGGSPVARNIVSGNLGDGILLSNAHSNLIESNLIGVGRDTMSNLANNGNGIFIDGGRGNRIGDVAPTLANIIRFNGHNGILVRGATAVANRLRGNSIVDNGGLGINLQGNGEAPDTVTPDDLTDADSGPNNLQNYPAIAKVETLGSYTFIDGTFYSKPGQYVLDFYSSAAADGSGYGEGATYLGSRTIPIGSNGNNSFHFQVAKLTGRTVSVTATSLDAGDTSEFSRAVAIPLSVGVTGAAAREGDGAINFTVWRSGSGSGAFDVGYATLDGTAKAGQDYIATSGTLHFADGEWTKTVRVRVIDDSLNEASETLRLTLFRAVGSGVVLEPSVTATGTIVDNDPLPALSIGNAGIPEGAAEPSGTMTFSVNLSAPSGRQVIVRYFTVDGSAHSPGDYTRVAGLLTFPPGERAKNIDVPVHNDALHEGDETFFVYLASPQYETLADRVATGTIFDDDAMPELSINDASVVEGGVGASSAAEFTVQLSQPSGEPVVVRYYTSDVTAHQSEDYVATSGTLVFAPNETTKRVPVKIIGDAKKESDETFTVQLTSPRGATIARAAGTATILDDD